MDAETLRRAFTEFFVQRGHAAVPSAGLIPHHPTAPLLTNAGMNQFIGYFVGEEPPPWPRATTVQKCFRTQDIDVVGTTTRHLTFFEMLGNFSFGDYFKADAIAFAWELVTTVLGLDPDRLWATVHLTDDEAERIWTESVGLPPERVQRLGDDNWWAPGKKTDPGPCGPCSEIFYDKGEAHGPPGGPDGGGPERYVEIWNLVFMQFNRQADGSLTELPRKNIDTGAGLERILPILQGTNSVFDTDVLRPLVAAAERATGRTYGGTDASANGRNARAGAASTKSDAGGPNAGPDGGPNAGTDGGTNAGADGGPNAGADGGTNATADEAVDVSLRILADHARAMTFLVNDGVLPSNEARGYVLRRIIRRAVRHAFQLGVEHTVTPGLVEATVAAMAGAYPDLAGNAEFITGVVSREEERFRRTLEAGMGLLEAELAGQGEATDTASATEVTTATEATEVTTATEVTEVTTATEVTEATTAASATEVTEATTAAGATDATVPADRVPTVMVVSGEVAFKLHDTYGFPIEITCEIAAERGFEVDLAGFETAMAAQRQRARQATAGRAEGAANADAYRELLEQFGTTEFTGYAEYESKARVLAVLPGPATGDAPAVAATANLPAVTADTEPTTTDPAATPGTDTDPTATPGTDTDPTATPAATVEIFLDRTPFYAEGGGQVGDTGTILTETGRAEILDTTAPVPGLHRHTARITEGVIAAGQEAVATIDAGRRDAIRRNHTGTHLLHWALREVVGTHVKQQGSLVAPDYLRFDFSNDGPVAPEQLERVEALVNERVLANEPVRAYETAKSHAEDLGAIAFFGDKYGDFVRVVEAGTHSMELCGGTHVHALGMIGPIKITSEASIGANMRRVFALTGTATLAKVREDEQLLERAAALLRAEPKEVPGAVERLLERQRAAEAELKALRTEAAGDEARRLAATAVVVTVDTPATVPDAGAGRDATVAPAPIAATTKTPAVAANDNEPTAQPFSVTTVAAGVTTAAAATGIVVARRDGLPSDQLRDLALAVRKEHGVTAVVLIGSPDGQRVALVAAVEPGSGLDAPGLVSEPARLLGGGGGGKGDVAVAGGKDPSRIDDALAAVRTKLGLARPAQPTSAADPARPAQPTSAADPARPAQPTSAAPAPPPAGAEDRVPADPAQPVHPPAATATVEAPATEPAKTADA